MGRIIGQPVEISKFQRHLNEFSSDARGRILEKTGQPRRWFYRFRNPLLQPFVILNGLASEKVDEALVAEMQQANILPSSSGFEQLL